MNTYIKDIITILNTPAKVPGFIPMNVTVEDAKRVFDQMMIEGVDFSECSARTFKREVHLAAAIVL